MYPPLGIDTAPSNDNGVLRPPLTVLEKLDGPPGNGESNSLSKILDVELEEPVEG